ncbi:MAG: SDR family oxidoreductase [Chloroflexota bacterium]
MAHRRRCPNPAENNGASSPGRDLAAAICRPNHCSVGPGERHRAFCVWSQSLAKSRRFARPRPQGRGQRLDIAWAAVYLASDEARWVTGQVLTVDAGITITIPGHSYT